MRQVTHMLLLLLLPVVAQAADELECNDCAAPAAVSLAAAYTGEMWRRMSGMDPGNRYLDNIDLTLGVDGAEAFGANGWQFFAALLYNNGRAMNDDFAGTVQGISNIEASEATRLFELWTQYSSAAGDASWRFGLYDLNSEFDSIDAAGLFLNPSHGIGAEFSQSGLSGPSIFPVTGLALRGLKSFGSWSVQAAALDAVPHDGGHLDNPRLELNSGDGALLVGEINYRPVSGLRLGGGYWRYTAQFDELMADDSPGEPIRLGGNAGAYFIAESPRLLPRAAAQGVNLFVRLGLAEDRINVIDQYYGAGAVYSGNSFNGGEYQLGLAAAIAQAGRPWRNIQAAAAEPSNAREYNYELTYQVPLLEQLTLQADLQYIRNPGFSRDADAAWVFGLRISVAQSWEW